MKYSYSEETLSVLKNAGWTYGRQIDANQIIQTIREKEFPLLKPAINFLTEYGELKMKFNDKKSKSPSDFNFDFSKAMDIVVVEGISDYIPRIGCQELCSIGTAYNDYVILMMDERGIVYGCYERFFAKMGDSGEECIENIVMDLAIHEIQ